MKGVAKKMHTNHIGHSVAHFRLTISPLAKRLPEIPPKEYEELKNSIREIGLLEPLVLNDANQILDGRHRYRACQELEIEPRTIHWRDVLGAKFGQVSEARFIFDANCHRRHLTDDQRAALCTEFLREFELEAKANYQKTRGKGKSKVKKANKEVEGRLTPDLDSGFEAEAKSGQSTRDKLAEVANVGATKAKKAIKLAKGNPELRDQVSRGEKKLSVACNEMEAKAASDPVPDQTDSNRTAQTNKPTRQRKLRSANKYDYGKVEKQWLKFWPKFLRRYEQSSWPIVRQFVIDSLMAETEANQDGVSQTN
jgi:ParB-like chromosome segregation protein Spo0J